MSKDLFQDGGPIKTNTRTFFSHGQFLNSNGISVRVWVEAFQKGQLFENPFTNDVFVLGWIFWLVQGYCLIFPKISISCSSVIYGPFDLRIHRSILKNMQYFINIIWKYFRQIPYRI